MISGTQIHNNAINQAAAAIRPNKHIQYCACRECGAYKDLLYKLLELKK